MPIFEYVCLACGAKVEKISKERESVYCPEGERFGLNFPMTPVISAHAKTPSKWEVSKSE